jgi:hypothetical protein
MAHRAIHSKFGAGVIITGGLGGHAQHSLIAKRYAIYIPNIDIDIVVEPEVVAGHGVAGSTTSATRRTMFRIRIVTENATHEKLIYVDEKRAYPVIKILNIVNNTFDGVKVLVGNFRNAATQMKINISNIWRDDK